MSRDSRPLLTVSPPLEYPYMLAAEQLTFKKTLIGQKIKKEKPEMVLELNITPRENQTIADMNETPASDVPSITDESVYKEKEPVIKEFNITAKRFDFEPSVIIVNKGDTVRLRVTSIDVTHGFALGAFNINEKLEPGETVEREFNASKKGTFPFICNVYCGAGHSAMKGLLIVE